MALPLVLNNYSAVIAAGQSLSAAVPMGADTLAGLLVPSGWTAAALTFQVSIDGGTTWAELYDDSAAEVTIASPPAGSFIIFNAHASYEWRGINMIKVRSGTAASAVVQTGGATVTLVGRPEIF